MRIIAGENKNKKLKTRKGEATRPTLGSMKESLFSIIAPYVPESRFLDLFAGSGGVSLEALSRGANRAIMIEKDGEELKFLIENVNDLGYEDRCRAYKNDAIRAIGILGRKGEKFDIIFMDPPYKLEICTKVIKEIAKNNILDKNGIIVAEHHLFERLDDKISDFKKVDEREYGKKCFTFFRR